MKQSSLSMLAKFLCMTTFLLGPNVAYSDYIPEFQIGVVELLSDYSEYCVGEAESHSCDPNVAGKVELADGAVEFLKVGDTRITIVRMSQIACADTKKYCGERLGYCGSIGCTTFIYGGETGNTFLKSVIGGQVSLNAKKNVIEFEDCDASKSKGCVVLDLDEK